MKKEIFICAIVVIFIVVLNIITSNHTTAIMDEITKELNEVREGLIQGKSDGLNEKIDKIAEKWKEKSEELAYYIEHDELEKVELYIVETKSNIETSEYNMAIQGLDSCKFIISHIKEKYKFSLKNIF